MKSRHLIWMLIAIASLATIYFAPEKPKAVSDVNQIIQRSSKSPSTEPAPIADEKSIQVASQQSYDPVPTRHKAATMEQTLGRMFPTRYEPSPPKIPVLVKREEPAPQALKAPEPKIRVLGTTVIDGKTQMLLQIDDEIVQLGQGDVFLNRFRLDRLAFPKSTLFDLVATQAIELEIGESP
jgi:hypothetical protein